LLGHLCVGDSRIVLKQFEDAFVNFIKIYWQTGGRLAGSSL